LQHSPWALDAFLRRLLAAFHTAAGRSVLTLDPGLNNIGCTPNPGGHTNGFGKAIFGTGAALHAAVRIMNPGFFIFKEKDTMGTYDFAHAATHAFIFVESQSRHTGKISKIFHLQIQFFVIEDEWGLRFHMHRSRRPRFRS
jgi:hypothetical protein